MTVLPVEAVVWCKTIANRISIVAEFIIFLLDVVASIMINTNWCEAMSIVYLYRYE